MTRKIGAFALLLGITLLTNGCATTQSRERKAQEIFNDANYFFAQGKYENARKQYQTILDEFPDTPFRINSLLGAADSYYMYGDYDIAAPMYERFVNLYPLNEMVIQAELYEAMSYFKNIKKMERDQTNTSIALTKFGQFVIKHPDHPATPFAKKNIEVLDDILAKKQIEIIQFYYRTSRFGSCIYRVDTFLENYEDTKYVPQALFLKGKSLLEEEALVNAEKVFETIVEKYPETLEGRLARYELSAMKKAR